MPIVIQWFSTYWVEEIINHHFTRQDLNRIRLKTFLLSVTVTRELTKTFDMSNLRPGKIFPSLSSNLLSTLEMQLLITTQAVTAGMCRPIMSTMSPLLLTPMAPMPSLWTCNTNLSYSYHNYENLRREQVQNKVVISGAPFAVKQ